MRDQNPTDLPESLPTHLKREEHIINSNTGATLQLGGIQRQ
jgi:hypothetical protein